MFFGAMGTVKAFRIQVMNYLIQFNDEYASFEIKENDTSGTAEKTIIN